MHDTELFLVCFMASIDSMDWRSIDFVWSSETGMKGTRNGLKDKTTRFRMPLPLGQLRPPMRTHVHYVMYHMFRVTFQFIHRQLIEVNLYKQLKGRMRLPTGLRGIAVPQLQSLLEQSLSSKGHLHRFAGHCRIPMRLPDGIPRFVSPIWLQNKFEIQFFFFFQGRDCDEAIDYCLLEPEQRPVQQQGRHLPAVSLHGRLPR